jgi:predicted  nucleic acid-binding Zn-ribbon protein
MRPIAAGLILLIGLAGCGSNAQQQMSDERAQIEASMAAAARIERERDEQVKRDAAAIVAAHNSVERDENAKAQAAAAEQEKAEEAAARK